MSAESIPVIIAVYVDDILIACTDDEKISKVKKEIAKKFDVKDMRNLTYFLGIKVVHNLKAGTIWMGQPCYTESILLSLRCNTQEAVKLL